MKTQALNVNLTAELRRYVKDQVRSWRYQNENDVVRDAIRQMQQREIEQFGRVFRIALSREILDDTKRSLLNFSLA